MRSAPSPILELQRSAGNRAVGALMSTPVQRSPAVQRASRDEHLEALRAAIAARDWQNVAVRLNGFHDPDIVRLSAGLSVGDAANTRAAVATHLAGWPQQFAIISALDRGRSEVARIGKVYEGYEDGVRTADWAAAVCHLNAMTKDDVDERLAKLPAESLRAVCAVAPESSERLAAWANAAARTRGIDPDAGLGPLVVGDRTIGQTREYLPGGGDMYLDMAAPAERGENATIGSRQIASGLVSMAGVVPLSAVSAAPVEFSPPSGPISGMQPIANPGPVSSPAPVSGVRPISAGPLVRTLPIAGRAAAGLAIRVPVVGVAFVAGLLGPYAVGWAIAHAADVAKALGEFGGTLAPGGAPLSGGTSPLPGPVPVPKPRGDDDDDDQCDQCTAAPPTYGPLDSLGRATGARAVLKGRTWSGEKPQEDPAGFVSGISGKYGLEHRAHLLARTLGGSGGRENLVPFGGAENIAMYHTAESDVETYVTLHPNRCVQYVSTPTYEDDLLSAMSIHVFAMDLCDREVIINRIVPNRTLH